MTNHDQPSNHWGSRSFNRGWIFSSETLGQVIHKGVNLSIHRVSPKGEGIINDDGLVDGRLGNGDQRRFCFPGQVLQAFGKKWFLLTWIHGSIFQNRFGKIWDRNTCKQFWNILKLQSNLFAVYSFFARANFLCNSWIWSLRLGVEQSLDGSSKFSALGFLGFFTPSLPLLGIFSWLLGSSSLSSSSQTETFWGRAGWGLGSSPFDPLDSPLHPSILSSSVSSTNSASSSSSSCSSPSSASESSHSSSERTSSSWMSSFSSCRTMA